jgi:glycosyltransferase involved in cell wall biosynthesis
MADSARPAGARDQRDASGFDVSVLGSMHNTADARLHRYCAALTRAGLRVEVVARGSVGDAPPQTVFRQVPKRGIVGRGLAAMMLPARARGTVLVTLDPDLVPAARLLRRLSPRRRLAVDLQEDYLAVLNDRPWAHGAVGAVAKLWAQTSTALSRKADLTMVADHHVPPLEAKRRLVVRNLPDLSMLPPPAVPDARPRALYIGDVRESRGLFTMLRMIELAPDWELDIVGPVAAQDQDRLAEWQRTSPAASRVRLHGRMPPAQAWKLAPGAWVGVSLLASTPAFEDAMPSKIFEYFACGLPVLSSPIRRAAELVREAGGGTVVANPEEAAAALNSWSAPDHGTYNACQEGARAWARRELAEANPHDVFASIVAELVASARRGRVLAIQTATDESR